MLGVIHKCIPSKLADFFRYFLNLLSPFSLADLAKKKFKSLILQDWIWKMFEAKSSLKQI